jgi:threonine aldolase
MTGPQSSPQGATPMTPPHQLNGEAGAPGATRKSFGSDNHAATHPAVLQALVAANTGDAPAYGADPWTAKAMADIRRLCGAEGDIQLVLNGSGANILGLGMLLGRHEAVICAESAHINTDECGSAERILGTKLLTVPTPDGKLTPELIATRLAGRGNDHAAQPSVVVVTQSTELGTAYTVDELRAIKDFCSANDLRVYLDGARLANAAAHLGCSLAELASTVDVLSFGGTKNGAMGVEAVVTMSPAHSASAPYLRKQHMQLSSKMRFLAAQFNGLLADDLWLSNARHANAMAGRLASGLAGVPGVDIVYPVQANVVFARLDAADIAMLQRDWTFHVWDESASVVRWMTAFDTKESDVDAFLGAIAAVTGGVRV